MPTAEELISLLGLQPHPKEGGFFRETYRAAEETPAAALPARYAGPRNHGTAIYYLLTPTSFSALHRLASDEVFHFYLGDPVRMLHLFPDGSGATVILGHDIAQGQQLQVVVPRGVWQGCSLVEGGRCALLGCTVAPGFDYQDYEHASRELLLKEFPSWSELIRKLTS